LVQLQRQASQTKVGSSGVAKGITGGTVGTGSVVKAKREIAFAA